MSRTAVESSPIASSARRSRSTTESRPRADRMRFLASTSRSPVRGSCGRYPTVPVLVIVPLAGCASPDRILVSVVLPAPFRPTKPILSPGATWKEACSNRRRAPARTSTSLATSIGLTLPYVTAATKDRFLRFSGRSRVPWGRLRTTAVTLSVQLPLVIPDGFKTSYVLHRPYGPAPPFLDRARFWSPVSYGRVRSAGCEDVRCLFRGCVEFSAFGARSWRTAESTGGGGMNAFRGNGRPQLAWRSALIFAAVVHHMSYDSSLQNQICGGGVRCPCHERQDRGGGERVGRVGQQAERPAWRDEVRQITLDDRGGMIAESSLVR